MDTKKQIAELISELTAIFDKVNPLRDKKEQIYQERVKVSKEISELVKQIKPVRDERNKLTSEVKTAKEERTKLTATIRNKIGEFRHIEKPVHGESPGKLKHEIDRIEYKIETEGIDFEKEKQLMKVIHELEKKLKDAEKIAETSQKAREASHEITDYKKKADEIHARIQENAKRSQEKHEQMVALSKKIEENKKKYQELTTQLEQARKELTELSVPIREKKAKLDELRKQQGENFKERKAQTEASRKSLLYEKQREVQEKLKKRQKLTTEDLIVLQSIPE